MLECTISMDNTVGSQEENVIIGTLLGDGFLERNGKHVRLIVDHSIKQATYVQWLKNQLTPLTVTFSIKKRFDERTGKVYTHHYIRTYTSSYLERYWKMFYVENVKHIPTNLPTIINPQILAIWIMDNGYKTNDCNAMRINTQSYSFDDHLIIQKSLKTLLIENHIQRHKAGFVTYIPSHSMTRLRTLVKPFIIESMEYKIL